jgi:chromosome segregation ATPase
VAVIRPDVTDDLWYAEFPSMTGPRRTRSSDKTTQPAKPRQDVFMPMSGPGVSSRPVGVSELVRRLGEAESRLQDTERDRAADAELIGNLLGEVAERDRRLKALQTRAVDDEARIRELEDSVARLSVDNGAGDRARDLELALRRTEAVFGELLDRLATAHGADGDVSELHDLLAVTLGALDLTRTFAAEDARKLEDTRAAMGNAGQREVERALSVTIDKTEDVLAKSGPVDRSLARVVDRLREIERRERELGDLRAALLDEAGALLADVQQLRDSLGALATTGAGAARRRPPSKLPTRRR